MARNWNWGEKNKTEFGGKNGFPRPFNSIFYVTKYTLFMDDTESV